MGSTQRLVSIFTTRAAAIAMSAIILAGLCGCAGSRSVEIVTVPPDATIRIDGIIRGKGRVVEDMRFGGGRAYTVLVSRLGYNDALQTIDVTPNEGVLRINLTPRTRRIRLNVSPYPAIVKVDGKPIADGEITSASTDLVFGVDDKDQWIPHVATAERPGFRRAERTINFTDRESAYALTLTPEQKDIVIRTEPAGADVTVDGEGVGKSPVTLHNFVISTDPVTHEWIGRKVRATRSGFEPVESTISWDEGKSDYLLKLTATENAVVPPPPSATAPAATAPVATAPAATAPATRPTPASAPTTIATTLPAPQPTSRDLALLRVNWVHGSDGWRAQTDKVTTTAPLQVRETLGKVTKVASGPAKGNINSLASSPDGSVIVYDVLWQKAGALAGQIIADPLDGERAPIRLTDGKSLDLTPAFAPDGNRIFFSSQRGGRGMAIYQTSLEAPAEPQRVSPAGQTLDLWPSLDSSPQPRLYVQTPTADAGASHFAIYQAGKRIELPERGEQLRVSPTADAVLFTRADPKTGKRDLFLLREGAEEPLNLTNSPDEDDFDPAWSKDGMQIAYGSDRALPKSISVGTTGKTPRHPHIWTIDLNTRELTPRPVTSTAAWDDNPAWTGDGKAIYFRSNRGGEWGIWKIELK